jgi:hypothetical protein
MTLEEYIKEQRERVANMTLSQARQIVANHYGHDDMRIECEKAVRMLLDCADEKINSGWIPVTERLPENAKHKGAFCPKYYVMTEYGVTEGWYNPNVKCWYVLLWFMDRQFEEWNINIDKGDIPKLVKNVPVIAWMPLPQPYKAESEGK